MNSICLRAFHNIDLQEEALYLAIDNYNRSVPRSQSSLKLVNSVSSSNLLKVHLKIFLRFRNPVNLTSVLVLGDDSNTSWTTRLKTTFKFKSKSAVYIPISNESRVSDIIQFMVDQFKIQDPLDQFSLYEKRSDYGNANEYYRKMSATEIPLNSVLNLSHRNLLKRFRLELYDFDPNLEDSYEENSIEDLKVLLINLDKEEEKKVNEIKEKYLKLHQMYLRYCQLKRPEQNSSCPDISKALRNNPTHKSLIAKHQRKSQVRRSLESLNQQETLEIRNKTKTCFIQ